MKNWLREQGAMLVLAAFMLVCWRYGHDERTIIWNDELRVCCARCGRGSNGNT